MDDQNCGFSVRLQPTTNLHFLPVSANICQTPIRRMLTLIQAFAVLFVGFCVLQRLSWLVHACQKMPFFLSAFNQLFVKSNQGDEETTKINYLTFIGTPVQATNMNDFKRVRTSSSSPPVSATALVTPLLLCRSWGRKVRVTERKNQGRKGGRRDERSRRLQSISGVRLCQSRRIPTCRQDHAQILQRSTSGSQCLSENVLYKSFILSFWWNLCK